MDLDKRQWTDTECEAWKRGLYIGCGFTIAIYFIIKFYVVALF